MTRDNWRRKIPLTAFTGMPLPSDAGRRTRTHHNAIARVGWRTFGNLGDEFSYFVKEWAGEALSIAERVFLPPTQRKAGFFALSTLAHYDIWSDAAALSGRVSTTSTDVTSVTIRPYQNDAVTIFTSEVLALARGRPLLCGWLSDAPSEVVDYFRKFYALIAALRSFSVAIAMAEKGWPSDENTSRLLSTKRIHIHGFGAPSAKLDGPACVDRLRLIIAHLRKGGMVVAWSSGLSAAEADLDSIDLASKPIFTEIFEEDTLGPYFMENIFPPSPIEMVIRMPWRALPSSLDAPAQNEALRIIYDVGSDLRCRCGLPMTSQHSSTTCSETGMERIWSHGNSIAKTFFNLCNRLKDQATWQLHRATFRAEFKDSPAPNACSGIWNDTDADGALPESDDDPGDAEVIPSSEEEPLWGADEVASSSHGPPDQPDE